MAELKNQTKDKIHMTNDGILVVNGQEYIESQMKMKKIDGIEHIDKVIFQKFDRKEINKKIEFISKKIKDTLDKEELVKELIKKKAINEIDKLYKLLKGEKKEIKVQKGCLGLKIGSGKPKTGGRYVQLID